tara:strand:+ start:449 stop:604 length:156 start_codon:yes stop_codon:yes gene_type:complete
LNESIEHVGHLVAGDAYTRILYGKGYPAWSFRHLLRADADMAILGEFVGIA